MVVCVVGKHLVELDVRHFDPFPSRKYLDCTRRCMSRDHAVALVARKLVARKICGRSHDCARLGIGGARLQEHGSVRKSRGVR